MPYQFSPEAYLLFRAIIVSREFIPQFFANSKGMASRASANFMTAICLLSFIPFAHSFSR